MEWFLLILTLVATGIGCLLPPRYLPPLPNDKFLHFAAYALLGLLALRLAHGWQQSAQALLLLFVIGWAIEGLQRLVPGRGFCWRDLAANSAGLISAALLSAASAALI